MDTEEKRIKGPKVAEGRRYLGNWKATYSKRLQAQHDIKTAYDFTQLSDDSGYTETIWP
jgi:hypothetical protein